MILVHTLENLILLMMLIDIIVFQSIEQFFY